MSDIVLTAPVAPVATTATTAATADTVNSEAGTAPTGTHVAAVEAKEEAASAIDVALWAKTNKANRELRAKEAEYQAKVKELETKLSTATTAPAVDQNALILEALKQPGAAKKLLAAGKTFEQIISELSDVETVDPVQTELQTRLAKLEEERAAEIASRADSEKKASERARADGIAQAQAEVTAFAVAQSTEVMDESDPRAGTPRFALLVDRPDLIETARDAAIEYLSEHHPKGTDQATVDALVLSALDQLELAERKKLLPVIQRIKPNASKPVSRASELARTITARADPFGTDKPRVTTITSDLSGPVPTAKPKGRFAGGPRTVTFSQ